MKILIIGPPAFGYTKYIHNALLKRNNIDADIAYIDRSKFKYKNLAQRVENFFRKTFLKQNIKVLFQDKVVLEKVNSKSEWDQILIIRPDLLANKTLLKIKTKTKKVLTIYYDSIRRFPRKGELISLFDEVYSYDKIDIDKYSLEFKTNYIFEETENQNYEYLFFNISSYDMRFESLTKIANYIGSKGWSSKVLVFHPNPKFKIDNISKFLSLDNILRPVKDVSLLIQKAKIILDIQREDQIGLSFRVFEALGHKKKLITTNTDVVNYDFYHPQNILVLDLNNIEIPDDFVHSPYVLISDDILDKYKIGNWTKELFKL